jgi:pimeloyl-ACP methyl ester carboxylesterase
VDFLARGGEWINKVVGEDFNLLSFDPRGVAGSKPQALCYPDAKSRGDDFASTPWSMDFEAGEMYTKAENKNKACQGPTGEHGLYINTPQTAADMSSILDAIGQEKMFYWGFSCKSIPTLVDK